MTRIAATFLVMAAALACAPPPAHAAPVASGAPVAVPAPHDRLLPLRGGRNFRDLGGYRAADGRTVKWGLLFRSGSMHGLTAADYRTLESRGIRVVCDLRDTHERASEPVAWPQPGAPRVLSDDYDMHAQSLMPAGDPAHWTQAQARASMTASYPGLLARFNGQYRRMFAELLAGHAPLAVNCSAGKDRTGVAAALLLTALGVPRATVVADYEATNRYLDAAEMMAKNRAANPALPAPTMSEGATKALMAADPAYIRAALAVLDTHRGGTAGYLRDELGLGPAQLARLRNLYLERS